MANTLIIGKEFPDCLEFAQAIAGFGRKVFGVSKSQAEDAKVDFENIFSTTWNKSSAVSAHTLIIQAENRLEHIDEVLFYFDANNFCTKYNSDKTEEISVGVDNMMTSFFYFTNELLKRIEQRKEKICVCFLVKEYPSKYEIISSKAAGIVPASTIVSSAQSSFKTLAENFSTNVVGRDYLSVILAKCGHDNELYKSDDAVANWIASSFDTLHNLKNPQTAKHSGTWNKVGSKIQTGFSLFR